MRLTLPALLIVTLCPIARSNQVTLTPTTVHSITPNVGFEYVGSCGLQFGFNTPYDIVHDGLVRFDVGSAVPPGARVNAVQLDLTSGFVPFTANASVYRIVSPWNACPGTTTWSMPWTQPGGDHLGASATAPMTFTSVLFGSTPSLVADVQTWVDQPATNHGWQLREPGYWGEAYFPAAGVFLTVDYDPPCPAPTTYCVGAPNSVGGGAVITSAGTPRISDHDFSLVVSGCSPNAPGFFFFGPGQQQLAWGDGFLCVDGPFYRLLPAVFANAQGTAVRPIDFTTGSATVITPGSTWNFQYKYRDIVSGGAGFNASNALSATFCP